MRRVLLLSVLSIVPACGEGPEVSLPGDAAPGDEGDVLLPDRSPFDAPDAFEVRVDAGRDATDRPADRGLDAVDRPVDGSFDAWTGDGDAQGSSSCAIRGVEGACVEMSICTSGQVTQAGLCPGAASVQCCAAPSATWCPTHGFPRPNEGLVEAPGDPGCLAGMVRVGTFCIDRYEAALVVLRPDGSRPGWSPYWHPAGGQRYRAVSVRGAVPQGYISGTQAAAACLEAGKRLCTDTEWLRACQGPAHATFPYGATRLPGVCNDLRSRHPAIECFGTSASWIWSDIGYPGINQLPDSLRRTGDSPGCVAAEGAEDLMGNLHEWTADPAGTFRGGYYMDTMLNGPGCLYVTTAHDTSHWDYSTGFRCCADAS